MKNYSHGVYADDDAPNINPYPDAMRLQLFPLCCGISCLSGFKNAYEMEDDALLAQINKVKASVPYNQVFDGEKIKPTTQLLVLNSSQQGSKKIVGAVCKAGFVPFAKCNGYGGARLSLTLYVCSDSWTPIPAPEVKNIIAAAA